MSRDGKDKFYRTLNLDNETRKLIREYRKWKEKAMNDRLGENENVYDQIQRQHNPERRRPKEDKLGEDSRGQGDSKDRDSDNVS